MKGLRRWITRTAIIIWAIVFISVAIIWVRSHWREDQIVRLLTYPQGQGKRSIDLMILVWNGNIHVHVHWHYYPPQTTSIPPENQSFWLIMRENLAVAAEVLLEPRQTFLERQNFMWHVYRGGANGEIFVQREMGAPFWSIELILATPGLWMLFRWRRRRRRRDFRQRNGLCIHCGYDLRATPGRCPECGMEGAT